MGLYRSIYSASMWETYMCYVDLANVTSKVHTGAPLFFATGSLDGP